MEEFKKTVAKRIVELRIKNNMTQLEMGEKLNYSDKAISKWERGESLPDVFVLKKMSEMFGVSVGYLIGEEDHAGEQGGAEPEETKLNGQMISSNRTIYRMITAIALLGVGTLALLSFVIMWIIGYVVWQIFIYTVPVGLIVWLVLNSLWGSARTNFYIVSALVWSILAAVYLSFLKYNWWLLFVLGIPMQIIVYFCFQLGKNRKH